MAKIKMIIPVMSLTLISVAAFGRTGSDFTHLNFDIDWSQPQSLQQGDSIYCQNMERATVAITAPGALDRDFTVQPTGSPCDIVSKKETQDAQGSISTTLLYQGDGCFSDNDVSFYVNQLDAHGKPTGKQAALTADSGC